MNHFAWPLEDLKVEFWKSEKSARILRCTCTFLFHIEHVTDKSWSMQIKFILNTTSIDQVSATLNCGLLTYIVQYSDTALDMKTMGCQSIRKVYFLLYIWKVSKVFPCKSVCSYSFLQGSHATGLFPTAVQCSMTDEFSLKSQVMFPMLMQSHSWKICPLQSTLGYKQEHHLLKWYL